MFYKLIPAIVFSLLVISLPEAVSAHQPQIVAGNGTVIIGEPEISRVYYGKLNGAEHWYRIVSREPFTLYLNILAPKTAAAVTDTRALVFRDQVSDGRDRIEPQGFLAELNYPPEPWQDYYEEFGGDWYLKGPELERRLPAGAYAVVVTRKGAAGEGRYALAIGQKENFSPGEILKALLIMPRLKIDFFDRSPLTAYLNQSGWYLVVTIVLVAVMIFAVAKIIRDCRRMLFRG